MDLARLLAFLLIVTCHASGWALDYTEQTLAADTSLRYRLLAPTASREKPLPLIVYLHGSGAKGVENQKPAQEPVPHFLSRAEFQQRFPCFVLVPQCPPGEDAAGRPQNWVAWKNMIGTQPREWIASEAEPSTAFAQAQRILDDVVARHPVDVRRVYVIGASMGGSGAWHFAGRFPERFAAIVPICGLSEAGWEERYRRVPLWAFGGAKDAIVPIERMRATVEALKRLEAPAKFTEFPDLGHDIVGRALKEPGLFEWLFAQQRSETASQAAEPVPVLKAMTGPFSSEDIAFFEKSVRPIFATQCSSCHGPEKQKGGLRADSREAFLKGGDTGPAIVLGAPEKSLLIEAVEQSDTVSMPPKSKLSGSEIAALKEWVKRGAPWPAGSGNPVKAAAPDPNRPLFTDADRTYWAYVSPLDPPAPPVRDAAWARGDLDRFVLAKLEAAGLKPAAEVGRRELLRRATLDLTGLLPSPEEMDAFLVDSSPDAFAKVVDRLLASPRYGERWGRHWLDVARFADSNGMEVNHAFANAWRYRDYVIAAFNTDKPYDRFVQEQLAGDLLPSRSESERQEQLTATGFLSIGPKVLSEIDTEKKRMDIIDEQIDAITRCFLASTVSCARCHDHKFDPIPTADYYSLAGILKSTRTMEHYNRVATWLERPLLSPEEQKALAARENELKATKTSLEKLRTSASGSAIAKARGEWRAYLLAAAAPVQPEAVPALASIAGDPEGAKTPGILRLEAEEFARSNLTIDTDELGSGIGVIRTQRMYPDFVEWEIDLAEAGRFQLDLRYAAAEPRPVKLSLNGKRLRSADAAQATGGWKPDQQKWEAQGVFEFIAGTNILRIERDGPIPILDKLALIPSALPVTRDEAPTAPNGLDPLLVGRWREQWQKALKDAKHPLHGLAVAAKDARPGDAQLAALETDAFKKWLADGKSGPFALGKDVQPRLDPEASKQIEAQQERSEALDREIRAVPFAMAVEDGTVVDVPILVRGSHLSPGEVVPRRFPRILAGERQAPLGASSSGRRELAEWMTRPNHPLTARVMVNRIWLWHFGKGLVRSPDNFGRQGDTPVQRELLDWLSNRFVQSGWSIKAMHRLIMNSAAYRMSCAVDELAHRTDPENRLLWRFERRRMDAETLRDSLLQASGGLDLAMGGTLFVYPNRTYVTGGNAPRSALEKLGAVYAAPRRSVYLPVIRAAASDALDTFDFPDGSTVTGERSETTVAPQALFMMNGAFVRYRAAALAASALKTPPEGDSEALRRIYRRVLNRDPRGAETERALRFVERYAATAGKDGRRLAWQAFCQAMLASNEFVFIE